MLLRNRDHKYFGYILTTYDEIDNVKTIIIKKKTNSKQ